MAKQSLGIGGAANDGSGDTLRAAADKVNDNFLEIYTLIGDTSSLTTGISATASVVTLTAPLVATSISPSSSDGATLGTTSLEWSDLFLADGGTIQFGNDQDTILTHTDGSGLTLNSTNKLMFNDASQFIQGASATVLDIAATDEIELTATLIEVVGNATVSGTLGVTGIATFTDDIIIGDGKTIGSASDVDAITIASTGVTTFSKAVVGATSTDTSNTGNVTLDFASFTNFVLTFTGNVTLDNPTTEVVGQSGFIVCIQDGTGSRTLSLGTDYETAGSGGITLSTAANARDIIPYAVSAAGSVILGAVQKAFG